MDNDFCVILISNPTFCLKRDIKDDHGKILFHAGTKINPLDKFTLHKVLFFLDADDKRQIKWALANVKKYDFVKYILVKSNNSKFDKHKSKSICFKYVLFKTISNLKIWLLSESSLKYILTAFELLCVSPK